MSSKTLPPSASASSSQLATTSDKGSVAWTACVDAAARFRTRSGSGAFHKSSFTIMSDQAMPHLSNSAYSTHRTAHGAARAPPPVQHFMAEFYAQNALDYELYLWALERHGLQAAYAPLVGPAVAFE